jgi:hypothetical protein
MERRTEVTERRAEHAAVEDSPQLLSLPDRSCAYARDSHSACLRPNHATASSVSFTRSWVGAFREKSACSFGWRKRLSE